MRYLDLDFFTFLVIDFLTAFFGFDKDAGWQSSSRLGASLPQESQTYFKLTSLGAQTCLGSPVIVPQNLQATTFLAITGLQR